MNSPDTTQSVRTHSGPFRLAVLISGGGSALQNLIDRIADDRLPGVRIDLVVSSRSDVLGVERARRAGLPVEIVRVKDHPDVQAFSDRLVQTLDAAGADLAVQAGWLCYWRLPPRWLGRVINLHPALLPKFGGQGYFGRRVHEAVLAAGETESGATVHWVDNEYDHGEIIEQVGLPVRPDETPESLERRVQAVESELLPRAILGIAAGRLRASRA